MTKRENFCALIGATGSHLQRLASLGLTFSTTVLAITSQSMTAMPLSEDSSLHAADFPVAMPPEIPQTFILSV